MTAFEVRKTLAEKLGVSIEEAKEYALGLEFLLRTAAQQQLLEEDVALMLTEHISKHDTKLTGVYLLVAFEKMGIIRTNE